MHTSRIDGLGSDPRDRKCVQSASDVDVCASDTAVFSVNEKLKSRQDPC